MNRLKTILKPYRAQFDRSPIWVKAISILCVSYIMIPIDLFDILFPWMAYSDDLFLATVLLKLLHKYGGLPDEDKTTAKDLLKEVIGLKDR
jgi:uncharacterized membrane protein YkvA (DUF1232 family)